MAIEPRTLGNSWDWMSNIGKSTTEYLNDNDPIHTDMAREQDAIDRMNAEREAERQAKRSNRMLGSMEPQGVTRPAPVSAFQGSTDYGSGNMHNVIDNVYPPAPISANEQIDAIRDNVRNGGVAGIRGTGNKLDAKEFEAAGGTKAMPQVAHPYQGVSGQNGRAEAYNLANSKLGTASPEFQRGVINSNRQKAAAGDLRIGGSQYGYEDMSPQAYKQMELERMGLGAMNKPEITQSQQYHADLKGKALPTRDMRPITTTPTAAPGSNTQYHNPKPLSQMPALDTNVQDPLGRQSSLGTNNQSSDNQMANNGNVNNPKITNKPASHGGGFF